ncbi:MAG: DUF1501 domain-containing protein [Devosia sp.]
MSSIFGCDEEITRRTFLKATAILSFAALPGLSLAAPPPGDGRLLVILLRGGMDGLYAVPPIGDKNLPDHRRDLIEKGLLSLDGYFALNPAMPSLHKFYQDGQALILHGASIPYTRRSHFEGQNMMEGGTDTPYESRTGWLGRALDAAGFPAVTMSLPIPLILRGQGFTDSSFPSVLRRPDSALYQKLQPVWMADPSIGPVGRALLEELKNPVMSDMMYDDPGDPQVDQLAREAGKRMAAPDGPHIAVIDDVGYDTHSKEINGASRKLGKIDDAIAAFARAVGPDVWKKSLVMTITEFGRTVAENGAWGTDHGYGTCVIAAGGLLKKSGVVADWPGLKAKNLFEGRDLLATVDARSLYGAALTAVLGLDPDLVRSQVINAPRTDMFDAYL